MVKATVFSPASPDGEIFEFETPAQALSFTDKMANLGLRVELEHPVLNGVVFNSFVQRVMRDAELSDIEIVKFVRCITRTGLREALDFCKANGLVPNQHTIRG